MPDGHLGEVIIATPELLKAKKIAHSLYEQAQNTNDLALIDKLNQQQREIYAQAEAATVKRLASSSDMITARDNRPTLNGSPVNKLVASPVVPSDTNLTGTSSNSKNVVPGDVNLKSVIDNKPFNNIITGVDAIF
ncbi:MAG: hypothetical protein WCJ86_02150 [Candidatus Saccharibacteria bacterium]